MGLDMGIISENDKKNKKKLLLDYLYTNLKSHNLWAYKYLFCEFLALINIFGNAVKMFSSFKIDFKLSSKFQVRFSSWIYSLMVPF